VRGARGEDALELARHRQHLRQGRDAGQLVVAERRRQLEQRERVAAALVDEAVADGRRGLDARARREQRGGGLGAEPRQLERRQVGGGEGVHEVLARREQHHDPLGVEAPRDEPQGVRGGLVEPVRVVDEAQHRPSLRELGQQREAAGEDEEPLLPGACDQAERGLQRARLRRRQRIEMAEGGPDQLVEGGEGQLRLRLDAAGCEHVHVGRAVARVREQRGLADPGLAAQDEDAAPRRARRVEQRTDGIPLRVATVEHPRPGSSRSVPSTATSLAWQRGRANANRARRPRQPPTRIILRFTNSSVA
jgi:hypothetical protein